jgi:chromate reductase
MLGIMKILAISGSLRADSINSALLRAAARLSPPTMEVKLFRSVGELPLFNPDLELKMPAQVSAFHSEIAASNAVLIASPEYAHGVTGTIKNALDWLVSFEPFIHKPVAVINTSPRAHYADQALRETLRTMSAIIVEEASTSIPLLGSQLTENGIVESPMISRAIQNLLLALHNSVVLRQYRDDPSFPLP